jgi:hypothetical protein
MYFYTYAMDNIIATLASFTNNHSSWSLEQFQNIHDPTIRATVRAAFREPTKYIEKLIQYGSKVDIDIFSLAVKEHCPFMYLATFASLLDILYSCEEHGRLYSVNFVEWFRDNGWSFPEFEFEKKSTLSLAKAKDIDYTN